MNKTEFEHTFKEDEFHVYIELLHDPRSCDPDHACHNCCENCDYLTEFFRSKIVGETKVMSITRERIDLYERYRGPDDFSRMVKVLLGEK